MFNTFTINSNNVKAQQVLDIKENSKEFNEASLYLHKIMYRKVN